MASVPFNNLITFSRGSNATVTGSNGLIQWAPNNIATNSESFNAAAYTKNSSTIGPNSTLAPDGTTTADTWTPTSNGNTGSVRLLGTFTSSAGIIATASIYVKSAGKRWVAFTTPSAASPDHNCWFDLQTGTVGTQGAAVLSATMTAVGNNWYRITTTSFVADVFYYIFLSTPIANNDTTVVADGTGVFIWGAQLELGSAATTYNSTTVKNLLGFSEAFDNAAWTKTRASIVTGAQANPVNGAFNAQKLMEDTTASNTHFVRFLGGGSVVTGAPYTFSVYMKASGRNWARLMWNGTSTQAAYFNLSSGTVGTVGSEATASITAVGSGWYRCSITTNPLSTSTAYEVYTSVDGTTTAYTGDGNSGVYIYGAQLSDSASLDPYVPTPAAAPSSTAYYGPRFDYDPVTLQPKGLLVEEARTNLFTYSARIGGVNWVSSPTFLVVGLDYETAPDGTQTSSLFTDTANSGGHAAYQNVAVTTGTTYTVSVFGKAGTLDFVFIKFSDGVSNWGTTFNVKTGVVGATLSGFSAPTSTSITPVGNGWYRCTITATAGATGTGSHDIGVTTTSGLRVYAGTGQNAQVWGAQFEAGAFATSYIPTVASTVTRSADVATINGSLFSQWYGQTAGTFVAQGSGLVGSGSAVLMAARTSGGSNLAPQLDILSATSTRAVYTDAAGTIVATNTATVGSTASSNKYAAAVNASGAAVVANGGTIVSSAISSIPAPTLFCVGGLQTTQFLNGHIRSIDYIPTRIADFQLQALTL